MHLGAELLMVTFWIYYMQQQDSGCPACKDPATAAVILKLDCIHISLP